MKKHDTKGRSRKAPTTTKAASATHARQKPGVMRVVQQGKAPAQKESTAARRMEAKKASEQLVAAAVEHIRNVVERKLAGGTEEIGSYVLDRFFGGDANAYASKDSTKAASLRSLTRRCGTRELPLSKTALASAIGVVVVARRLPRDSAFAKLPASYRAELLPLRDAKKIEEAAADVLNDSTMSARTVRAFVRKTLAKPAKEARPALAKAIDRVTSALAGADASALLYQRGDVEALDVAAHAALSAKVERAVALIADVRALLVPTRRPDVGTVNAARQGGEARA